MRGFNLTTLAALILAGAVVLASAAPSRSRRSSQRSWPFGLEEQDTSEDTLQQSPLMNKVSSISRQ